MNTITTILNSQSSFFVAVVFVTWVAMGAITLVVVNLHVRLSQLERQSNSSHQSVQPYSQFLGRTVGELFEDQSEIARARMILFMSASCPSCQRILQELETSDWRAHSVIVWTTASPGNNDSYNEKAITDGPRISSKLGIRVTPFGMATNERGRVVVAAPINSLKTLARHLEGIKVSELASTV